MRNIALITSLAVISIANANELLYPDQVTWGKYCGECMANCSTMRRIDHSSLSIDTSDQFFKSSPFKYNFSGNPAPHNEFEKFQWLLSKPIPPIISNAQSVFGQPDAYDQCGYYVAYRANQKEFRILIDPHRVPEDLDELVKELFHESQ